MVEYKYYPQLDTLRFIAVAMVCINHWLPYEWVEHSQMGRAGVELFFVLSGFLITRILINPKQTNTSRKSILKIFYIRRILRIFPAYYFVVILTYIFHSGHFDKAIIWNLSYLSNFYMLSIESFPGIMSHFWSLSVEEHFYLVWPFLILLVPSRYLKFTMLAFGLLAVVSRITFFLLGYSGLFPLIFSLSCFDAFAIGGVMGYLSIYKYGVYKKLVISNILLISLLVLLLGIYYLRLRYPEFYFVDYIGYRTVVAMLSILIIGRAIRSQSMFLHNKYFNHFGKISYSMYLFHNFVPGFLLGVPLPENNYFRLIMYFIVLIVVAHLSYKLIEIPFNRWKNHFKY